MESSSVDSYASPQPPSKVTPSQEQALPPPVITSQVEYPLHSLVVIDDVRNRVVLLSAISLEIYHTIALGVGFWYGLCIHRTYPSPEGVLVAVSDGINNLIKIFDVKTTCLLRIIDLDGEGDGELYPYFLCMFYPAAGENPRLLVSSYGRDRIHVLDFETGGRIRSIGACEELGPQRLNGPGAIAVWTPQHDPTNAQVVVADCGNHRLQFFRLSDGMYVKSVGEAGTGPGQLQSPWAMSIHMPAGGRDEDALLVTIGYDDCRIHVYGLVSGEYLRCLGGGIGRGVDQLQLYVYGITFYRPADGDEAATQVIVSDNTNCRLQVFNLYSGAHICSVGGEGSGLFQNCVGIDLLSLNDEDGDYILK